MAMIHLNTKVILRRNSSRKHWVVSKKQGKKELIMKKNLERLILNWGLNLYLWKQVVLKKKFGNMFLLLGSDQQARPVRQRISK